MPANKKTKPRSSADAKLWPRFRTGATIALTLALPAGVIGAALFADRTAARITADRAAKDNPLVIEIEFLDVIDASTDAPTTWPPASEQQALIDAAYAALDAAAQDGPGAALADRGLEPIARAVEASGWVASTPRVTRENRGRIRVECDWLLAAAVVRDEGLDYLLSTDARPLPLVYRAGTTQFKAIINTPINASDTWNARARAPQPIPEPIITPQLDAALEIITLLENNPGSAQVAAIDVGNTPSGLIEIVTDRRHRVVWGSPPGQERPGEVPARDKLERLASFATDHDYGRRIDAGVPRLEIHTQQIFIDPQQAGSGGP